MNDTQKKLILNEVRKELKAIADQFEGIISPMTLTDPSNLRRHVEYVQELLEGVIVDK
jgi:hypothetical protein